MHYTEKEIQERTDRFCKNPRPLLVSDEQEFLQDLIQDLLHENDPVRKIVLFSGIFKITHAAGADKVDLASIFRSVGFRAYEQDEIDVAEAAFKGAVAINNGLSDRNNLAYIMRRSNHISGSRIKEVIDLLSDGIRIMDSHCLINMALLLSITLGSESDWKIADSLMAMVAPFSNAVMWWQELGEKNDAEGYLIHLWMLRHHVITESALGTRQVLWEKVRAAYPNVPIWLNTDSEQKAPLFQYPEQESE